MAVAWPANVPSSPLLDSFSINEPDVIVQGQTDIGPPVTRIRANDGMVMMKWAIIMSITQYNLWATWYREVAGFGSLTFNLTDPLLLSTEEYLIIKNNGWSPVSGVIGKLSLDVARLP